MEGKTLAKLAKDCKLIDKKLTATDVDLIFAKVKDKTERKITFEQYLKAVEMFAEKKGASVEDVTMTILSHGGPVFSGTKADAVKFHDDKNLYTGVYAQGGPTNVDSIHPVASFGQAPAKEEEKKSTTKKSTVVESKNAPAGSLDEVFQGFTGGAPEMDGKTFAKLAKDTKILDKALTATDIDLIFTKVKDKTARKINIAQFHKAVAECAAKKKISVEQLSAQICAVGGPVFAGTKADAVKFHDDKSLYTGVYAQGGPSTIDAGKGMISDISQLCDRSNADVRGIKKNQ
jgi:hypothetical protein